MGPPSSRVKPAAAPHSAKPSSASRAISGIHVAGARVAVGRASRADRHAEAAHHRLGRAHVAGGGDGVDHRDRLRLPAAGRVEIAALEGRPQLDVEPRREVVGRSDAAAGAGRERAEQRFVDAPRQVEAPGRCVEAAAVGDEVRVADLDAGQGRDVRRRLDEKALDRKRHAGHRRDVVVVERQPRRLRRDGRAPRRSGPPACAACRRTGAAC